jgi:DNA-binding CsgD family transcriptional regulator/PAS domain-containing protein
MTDGEDEAFALIGSIYDAALDEALWPATLNRLADALGAPFANMAIYDPATRLASAVAPRTDPDYVRSYCAHWGSRNVLWHRAATRSAGTAFSSYDFASREEFTRTDIYNEWWSPQGLGMAALGTNVLLETYPSGAVASGIVGINRTSRSGEFSPDEIRLFTLLAPHLQRAVELYRRLSPLGMLRSHSAGLFDHLEQGVLLVDVDLKIQYANRAAEAMFARGKGLRLDDYGLAAQRASETANLRKLIAASVNDGGLKVGPVQPFQVSRGKGDPPLSLIVIPLRADVSWLVRHQPAAVIFVTDPDLAPPAADTRAMHSFGLTRTEVAFAREIARGDGIQAAADRLGIGRSTARTHLQRIFDKTGTHRQAELVRLLLTHGVAPLRRSRTRP